MAGWPTGDSLDGMCVDWSLRTPRHVELAKMGMARTRDDVGAGGSGDRHPIRRCRAGHCSEGDRPADVGRPGLGGCHRLGPGRADQRHRPLGRGPEACAGGCGGGFGRRDDLGRSELLAVVSPYVWTASRLGKKVTSAAACRSTSSRVPSSPRQGLLPNEEIVDGMQLARGAPTAFNAGTVFAFERLADMSEGDDHRRDVVGEGGGPFARGL